MFSSKRNCKSGETGVKCAERGSAFAFEIFRDGDLVIRRRNGQLSFVRRARGILLLLRGIYVQTVVRIRGEVVVNIGNNSKSVPLVRSTFAAADKNTIAIQIDRTFRRIVVRRPGNRRDIERAYSEAYRRCVRDAITLYGYFDARKRSETRKRFSFFLSRGEWEIVRRLVRSGISIAGRAAEW